MRARNIKPGFFSNEDLSELDAATRLLFIGLWCYADRDGRFEWRPKRIKAAIFPYDNLDIEPMLMSLHAMTFIYMYRHGEHMYGLIPNFAQHQRPHPHEAKSVIPEPPENIQQIQCHDMCAPRLANVSECTSDSLILGLSDIINDGCRMDNAQPDVVMVIESMNDMWGTHYKTTAESTKKLIRARLAEGYTVDDLISVCKKQLDAWGDDPKMVKYLRPETVFNQTKFPSYLNARSANSKSAKPDQHIPYSQSDINTALRARKVVI